MTVHVAYLAGIIDGEGSIMLVRTGRRRKSPELVQYLNDAAARVKALNRRGVAI